ncbi:MAG: TraR/DksA family transcriptional regulator [Nitrospirota bacterium]
MTRPRISPQRRNELLALLHGVRERTVRDIETQLGRRLSTPGAREPDLVMDVEDLAAKDLGEGVDYALLEMRYRTYKDIAEAFRRMDARSYGVCDACRRAIPIARLKAEPFARLCVPCQNLTEHLERVAREEQRFQTSHTPPPRGR